MEKLYTLHETADELGLSYTTIRTYVHYGKIRATKHGRNRMVAQSEIDRMKALQSRVSTPS